MARECSFDALKSQEYFRYRGSWYLKFSHEMVALVKPAADRFDHVKLVPVEQFAGATVMTASMQEALGTQRKPRKERRKKLILIGITSAVLFAIISCVLLLLKW